VANHAAMNLTSTTRRTPDLERALLRRGVSHLSAESECCGHCRRRPLIGERVYSYESGALLCELCRALEPATPLASRLVHGPEFGHTMKIIDRRPSAGHRAAT
jgi:hypothetical protein